MINGNFEIILKSNNGLILLFDKESSRYIWVKKNLNSENKYEYEVIHDYTNKCSKIGL